jgi:hypothetical protein
MGGGGCNLTILEYYDESWLEDKLKREFINEIKRVANVCLKLDTKEEIYEVFDEIGYDKFLDLNYYVSHIASEKYKKLVECVVDYHVDKWKKIKILKTLEE